MDSLLQATARIMRPGAVQHEAFQFVLMVTLAALLFTVGGVFMKLSEGLTKFWPTVITLFALFLVGAALQTLAMKREDLAVTYLWVVGPEIHPRVCIWCPAVQRELHAGTNCRRAAHRQRHHLASGRLLNSTGRLLSLLAALRTLSIGNASHASRPIRFWPHALQFQISSRL